MAYTPTPNKETFATIYACAMSVVLPLGSGKIICILFVFDRCRVLVSSVKMCPHIQAKEAI